MLSDFLMTEGSIKEATVSSSHIMDHMEVPAGGLESRYTLFTCLAKGPPLCTTRRINSGLDQTCAPASNGVTTISFQGARRVMDAASGSHHQFSSAPPALLPPMM